MARQSLVEVKNNMLFATRDIPFGTPIMPVSPYLENQYAIILRNELTKCTNVYQLQYLSKKYSPYRGNVRKVLCGSDVIVHAICDIKAGQQIFNIADDAISIIAAQATLLGSLFLVQKGKFEPKFGMPPIFPNAAPGMKHVIIDPTSFTDLSLANAIMASPTLMESAIINRWLKIFGYKQRGWQFWLKLMMDMQLGL